MSVMSVSRIVVMSDGGRHMSAIKLDKGRSIFYTKNTISELTLSGSADGLTRRLLSLLSSCLLRSCKSDICPDTAPKSFWNVDKNDSSESSRFRPV